MINGLLLTDSEDGLLIRPASSEDQESFYRRLRLLQAGLAIYGHGYGRKELVETCMRPLPPPQTDRAVNGEAVMKIPAEAWKEIEWIFQHEDRLAAYWWAVSLTEEAIPRRYLALYYALSALKKNDHLNPQGREKLEKLKIMADRIRQDEEEAEERGEVLTELIPDERLFEEAQELLRKHFEDNL